MSSESQSLSAGDYILDDWRRRATDAVIIASLFIHVPVLIILLLNYGPRVTGPFKMLVMAVYVNVAALAILRRISYRIRVQILLPSLYLLALVAGAAFPQGPIARLLPIAFAILALGLIGIEAGKVATAASALVLMFAPYLRYVPGFVQAFCAGGESGAAMPGYLWAQSAGLTAEMLVLVILLERFYTFLLKVLDAQRQTAEKLDNEIKERRILEREITQIGDEERRRLGYEVHDGICQQLTGALLRCGTLERRVKGGSPLASEDLSALSSLLADTMEEARSVAHGLCPLEPDPGALVPALRALTRHIQKTTAVPCEFQAVGDVRVPDDMTANHLYRIAQEALSNAVRHAHAGKISVELSGNEDTLTLQVRDNGIGLHPGSQTGGMGLRTMQHRAQMIEGEFMTEAAAGGGTRISCRVPRSQGARAEQKQREAIGSDDEP